MDKPAESFFRRWSRRKNEADSLAEQPAPKEIPAGASEPERDISLPTMEDAARLTADSDYSAFVRQGVDKAVQRMALKKLFSDPHFNIMDGLDIYIDDYNKASPLSDAMLASLRHARHFLERAGEEPAEDAARGEDEEADKT